VQWSAKFARVIATHVSQCCPSGAKIGGGAPVIGPS